MMPDNLYEVKKMKTSMKKS
jgi:hypothetical protein